MLHTHRPARLDHKLLSLALRQGLGDALGEAEGDGLNGDHGVHAHRGGQQAAVAHVQPLRLPALAAPIHGAVLRAGPHLAAAHLVRRAMERPLVSPRVHGPLLDGHLVQERLEVLVAEALAPQPEPVTAVGADLGGPRRHQDAQRAA